MTKNTIAKRTGLKGQIMVEKHKAEN